MRFVPQLRISAEVSSRARASATCVRIRALVPIVALVAILSGRLPAAALECSACSDIAIGMWETPDPVLAGNQLWYSIYFWNRGPQIAFGVKVTAEVPANTTFVSFSTSLPRDRVIVTTPPPGGTGTVTMIVPYLPDHLPNDQMGIIVRVNPDAPEGATITNTASASAASVDLAPEDNTATVATRVTHFTADLGVAMSAAPNPIQAGSDLTYSITLSNRGPDHASRVILTVREQNTATHVTFVSFTQTTGPEFVLTTPSVGSPGPVTATIDTLGTDVSATFTLVVTVPAETPDRALIQTSAITESDAYDPTPWWTNAFTTVTSSPPGS
ncbi:MAG: DUF11 domain-containing protein [Chloroflexi bacterium]|nr:MAG: DUF11 domain-containing protein [Chloroflexota bacterium]